MLFILKAVQEQKAERKDGNKKAGIVAAVVIAAVILIITTVIYLRKDRDKEIVYKETTVEHGNLTVGVTESGNVEIGTATQELKLDISAFTTQNAGVSFQAGGLMGMAGNALQGSGTEQSGSRDRTLQVEAVYVSGGQEVAAGDALFRLTDESVEAIRTELEGDVTEAELTLKQRETEQKSTVLSAGHEYEVNVAYGEAAQVEYDEAMEEASGQYQDAADALQEAQEELVRLQEEEAALAEKQAEDSHLYDEAAYLVEYIDKEEDPYGYVQALALRENALATAEGTREQLEEKQEAIEEQQKQIEKLGRQLREAEKARRLAEIEAKAAYDTRTLKYRQASELYAVASGLAEEKRLQAQEEYDSTVRKLNAFDSIIVDNTLVSEYAGLITEVLAGEGDYLAKGTQLITLNDYGDVTITVSVGDDNISHISVGDEVNLSLAAFPEAHYTGTVEEISDAQINSDSEVSYDVTVKIEGSADGIYEGMSGEVTFITKEMREVDYLSNRAVIRDGTESYVLVRDEAGGVVRQPIKTGFSDGVNVEVLEGPAEGDIVLIESKLE